MENIEKGKNEEILKKLKTDLYVNEDNTVNVEKLVGPNMKTGKGSIEKGDVYVIEQKAKIASEVKSDTNTNMDYYLIYYDDEKVDINLGLAFEYDENTSKDWNEIFETAQKHPEQSEENEAIGIDSEGNPVNMDLWNSKKVEDGYGLNHGGSSGDITPSYKGAFPDGKIEGTVPKYIKKPGDDKFYKVTSMYQTFYRCGDLTQAPEIPDSVINMNYTFHGCSRLTQAPEIPDSVTNMYGTFCGCSSLTQAPEIPDGVINMNETFRDCSSLTQAPEIPDSVTDMYGTFYDCSSLTGTIVINANPDSYNYCFSGASTSPDANLVLTGLSENLEELLNTKSEDSNISLGK